VFFIVSGFLVTRSVLTQPTLVDYAVARFLRLFPALLATCIFIAFLLGPAVTSVSFKEYFSDPRPWLYVPLTASLVTHSLTLPGVFEHVPDAGLIDPPLWTLHYETACYILLGAFALVGLLATRARASLTLAGVFAAYLLVTFATPWRGEIAAIDSIARFVLGFFVGGAFYLYADKISTASIFSASLSSRPLWRSIRPSVLGRCWCAASPPCSRPRSCHGTSSNIRR
jgi:peptidoglycan/LPS O-acetylase OafA/YrhL